MDVVQHLIVRDDARKIVADLAAAIHMEKPLPAHLRLFYENVVIDNPAAAAREWNRMADLFPGLPKVDGAQAGLYFTGLEGLQDFVETIDLGVEHKHLRVMQARENIAAEMEADEPGQSLDKSFYEPSEAAMDVGEWYNKRAKD